MEILGSTDVVCANQIGAKESIAMVYSRRLNQLGTLHFVHHLAQVVIEGKAFWGRTWRCNGMKGLAKLLSEKEPFAVDPQ